MEMSHITTFTGADDGVHYTHIKCQVKSFILAGSKSLTSKGVEGTQVVTVMSGSIELYDSSTDTTHDLKMGQVGIVPPNTAHLIRSNGEESIIMVAGTIGAYSEQGVVKILPNFTVHQDIASKVPVSRDLILFENFGDRTPDHWLNNFADLNIVARRTKAPNELLILSSDRTKVLEILGEHYTVYCFKWSEQPPRNYHGFNTLSGEIFLGSQ